jgi:putative Holliday junction resolvase
MGLDFGAKTVGVAISDPLFLTAQGIEVIRREREDKKRQTLARLEELIIEYEVREIVLGMPYHMDNHEGKTTATADEVASYGERGLKTLDFKEQLERRTGLEVILRDERLTTMEAQQIMTETGTKAANRKDYVDIIAAVLILQGYLHEQSNIQA